jgi:D-alanyl-D-alanine carboxypeptidase
VWVSFTVPAAEQVDYLVAFFDRETASWKIIPSTTNVTQKRVTAALPFTYATVAVFSIPQLGPEPVDDFHSVDSVLGSLQAASAVVLDVETGDLLYSKNADEVRSIASMTKVITTHVALDYADDWSEQVAYDDEWSREGAALHILDGETISIQDLLYTTLVGSANNTAVGLANVFTDQTTFVDQMNDWVNSLGLTATQVVEPSGLDARNVSTAHEYALLAREAFESFSMLQLATTKTYTLHLPVTGDHTIHTTDNLLYSDLYVTGGKTGYTEEAGYCLMIQTKNADGHQIIIVVMGEPSSADRFTETYALAKWAFSNYSWN